MWRIKYFSKDLGFNKLVLGVLEKKKENVVFIILYLF